MTGFFREMSGAEMSDVKSLVGERDRLLALNERLITACSAALADGTAGGRERAREDLRAVLRDAQAAPSEPAAEPQSWAVVELMGHVKMAGRISEEERFGAKLGRVDVPTAGGGFVTQHFSGSSVYRITYVDEAAARVVAVRSQVQPVHPWELPRQIAAPVPADVPADDQGDDEDDGRPPF